MKKTLLFGIMLVCNSMFLHTFAAVPMTDDSTYVARVNGKFSFANKWIYSYNAGNYNVTADLLAPSGNARGMIVKDGKMLFINRSTKSILVVNGQTGLKETPLELADNFFTFLGKNKAGTADSLWTAGVLTHNDIHVDNAGNVLVGNLINMDPGAKNRRFQVWQVNMTDGTGKVIIDAQMDVLFPLGNIRFDAFGVWGDVNGKAVIMAVNANAMEVYKWDIISGVVGTPKLIELDNSGQWWFGAYTAATNSFTPLTNPGSAPRVLPLDDNYFYVDGNTTYPTLCDQDGNVIDGFYKLYNNDGTTKDSKAYAALTDSISTPGKKMVMNPGHNGLAEFSLGGEEFLVMAATNTAGSPSSSFRILKFADATKAFSGLTQMWTFPKNGMGVTTNSNSYRTGMPSVEILPDGTTARIYVYTGEVGYGMYEMKYIPTGVEKIHVSNANITLNHGKILITESVKSAEIYSVSGVRLASAYNTTEIAAPAQKGIYIVRVTDNFGAKKVQKIAIQ